ncbi:uncharacterized protein METZ01_LOCUS230401, partial [marine metagenome]
MAESPGYMNIKSADQIHHTGDGIKPYV